MSEFTSLDEAPDPTPIMGGAAMIGEGGTIPGPPYIPFPSC